MNRFKLAALVLTLALAACKSSQKLPVDAGQPDTGVRLGLIAPVQKTDGTLDDPTTGNALGTTAHPMIVSGTIGVDTTALATASKQDTAQASLTTIAASAAGSKAAGQATMANSVPVVISSNQSTIQVQEVSGATIATNTGNIPAKGTAVMTGSTPVTIATNDTVAATLATAANQTTQTTALNLLTQPTTSAAVTPSDSTVLACGKGLWIGTAGNLSLKLSGDSAAVTWSNVPSGAFTPGSVIRVMAATTATNIVCLN